MNRRSLGRILCGMLVLGTALPLRAQLSQSDYQARRATLAASVGDGVILAFGAGEPEEDYMSFYQRPRFAYLTGFIEPDAALVMVKRGGQVSEMMFVLPRDPAKEVWTGTRRGVDGVRRLTGMSTREMRSLPATLDTLLASNPALHVVGDYSPPAQLASRDDLFMRALKGRFPAIVAKSVNSNVDVQRRVKNAAELALLRKSIAVTVLAQREAMRAIRPGMNEFEIQSLIEYTFRRNGSDRPSFATIVGSGPNSTTLHYNADDRFMNDGEVVLMDIGASYRGYAADVTRTVPVNGVFSPAQREIYQAVRDAQSAAERAATFGAPGQNMIDASLASLKSSLTRLGLIESPDATYECGESGTTCPQYRLFNMHGLGHGIGLEVHDPWYDSAADRLTPGHAFTIEPGIYVRGNTLDIISDTPRNRALKDKIRAAVTRYANIGVRIEDDYIVTANDVEWVSRAPREISEIEALMRDKSNGPAARDAATVEWYRATTPREPGGL
ncbi:MAG: aminopeptidase P N-terminal domain-containing protein [Gemmatimonadaceae bacterium]|nr:aminopeptidase P N-terminal domain-containing protein [Gemmatimonadaceae bacterium]